MKSIEWNGITFKFKKKDEVELMFGLFLIEHAAEGCALSARMAEVFCPEGMFGTDESGPVSYTVEKARELRKKATADDIAKELKDYFEKGMQALAFKGASAKPLIPGAAPMSPVQFTPDPMVENALIGMVARDPIMRADIPEWDTLAPLMAPRSGKWSTVEHQFKEKHPACEACGTKILVAVHHVKPFHLFPEDELEESNLISLCAPHHLLFGHLMNWRAWNPHVRTDVALWKEKIARRPLASDPAEKEYSPDA